MKRYINWVLAGLATITALAALRPRPQPAAPEAPVVGIGSEPTPSRWFDEPLGVAKAVAARLADHHMPMIAGSLSYYAFLAMLPAAIAAISIYGLVLNPADLAVQIEDISAALPEDAAKLIDRELTELVASSGSGLGLTAFISIVAALWSASAGTKALITGIDIAYETPESRSFIVLRGMALIITLGMIVVVAAAASAVTFLPDLLDAVGAESATRFVQYGRWPAIFVIVIAALGLLYKVAPNRPAAKSPWISIGAVVVAVLWLLATLGFSLYFNNASSFGATYGALAGIIVLLLWFFMSGLIVLVGAELNAELEARNLARKRAGSSRTAR